MPQYNVNADDLPDEHDTQRFVRIPESVFEETCAALMQISAGYRRAISSIDQSPNSGDDNEGLHCLLTLLTQKLDGTVAKLLR